MRNSGQGYCLPFDQGHSNFNCFKYLHQSQPQKVHLNGCGLMYKMVAIAIITSIPFTKSLVYALQPFIVDAYRINNSISLKPTLKSPLVDFRHG